VISVESGVDRISADREYFLHIRDAMLENQSFPISRNRLHTAGWRQRVHIAIKKFEVEELFENKRQGIRE
jgi:hypothetical protein